MPNKPVISVIIPAYNEEKYIAETLKSVLEQDFKKPYEVIVVDNASTDKTSEIAESFKKVRVVFESHKGVTWAREKGFKESKAEILAYLDADSLATPNWLSVIYKTFRENPELIALSGLVYFYDWQSDFIGQFLANLFERRLVIEADRLIRKTLRKAEFLWGANFAVRKEALKQAGGFNKNIKFYGEDTELSLRLAKVGKMKFVREMVVYTSARRFKEGRFSNSLVHFAGYLKELFFTTPLESKGKRKKIFSFRRYIFKESLKDKKLSFEAVKKLGRFRKKRNR